MNRRGLLGSVAIGGVVLASGCLGIPFAGDGYECDDDLDIPDEVREALPEYDDEPEDLEERKRELSLALYDALVRNYEWAWSTGRPSGPIVTFHTTDAEKAEAYVPDEWGCITIEIHESAPPEPD